jgi:hypothetical protein
MIDSPGLTTSAPEADASESIDAEFRVDLRAFFAADLPACSGVRSAGLASGSDDPLPLEELELMAANGRFKDELPIDCLAPDKPEHQTVHLFLISENF